MVLLMPSDVHVPTKLWEKKMDCESKMGPVSLADIHFNLKINTDMLSLTRMIPPIPKKKGKKCIYLS